MRYLAIIAILALLIGCTSFTALELPSKQNGSVPSPLAPVNSSPAARSNSTTPRCIADCSVKEVTVRTADNEIYHFKPGKGTYTAAGAIDWRIDEVSSYCGKPRIPITVTMYSYGNVVGKENATLGLKEKSKLFEHPTITHATLQLTVDDILEECSVN